MKKSTSLITMIALFVMGCAGTFKKPCVVDDKDSRKLDLILKDHFDLHFYKESWLCEEERTENKYEEVCASYADGKTHIKVTDKRSRKSILQLVKGIDGSISGISMRSYSKQEKHKQMDDSEAQDHYCSLVNFLLSRTKYDKLSNKIHIEEDLARYKILSDSIEANGGYLTNSNIGKKGDPVNYYAIKGSIFDGSHQIMMDLILHDGRKIKIIAFDNKEVIGYLDNGKTPKHKFNMREHLRNKREIKKAYHFIYNKLINEPKIKK